MSEELYNSNDYCSLAEENEELKKENAELLADKLHLIGAAMDGGDKYHYAAHDIGYRDMERKVKALEADYVISNRELLILQSRIAELEAENERLSQFKALEAENAKLRERTRWIPVGERLPDIEDGDSKDYDVVLTYPFRRDVIVAIWSYDALDKTHRRRWFDCSSDEWGSSDITEYVTHWRERPTPPEVQE